MSDKIKRAARERQARTGEPYTLARRMVIEERERLQAERAGTASDEPLADVPGEWLARLFGPLNPEPSDGPPYTHVLRPPETEEELAAAPFLPTHTITTTEGGTTP